MNQSNNTESERDYWDIEDILAHKPHIYGLLELNEIFNLDLEQKPKRILVIEDDSTFEPIWDHIITMVNPKIEFYWASDPIQAQELIYKSKNEGWSYDLIISDIYLSSSITGIDLWNRFGKTENFLLISSIDNHKLIEQAKQKGKTPPPYIQKPLDESECKDVISKLINLGSDC